MQMPPATDLTRDCLGEEGTYRMLSSMAHGHSWALQQLGFSSVKDDTGLFLEKSVKPLAILFLALKATEAFMKPVRFKFKLFGWDPGTTFSSAQSLLQRIFALYHADEYPLPPDRTQSA